MTHQRAYRRAYRAMHRIYLEGGPMTPDQSDRAESQFCRIVAAKRCGLSSGAFTWPFWFRKNRKALQR